MGCKIVPIGYRKALRSSRHPSVEEPHTPGEAPRPLSPSDLLEACILSSLRVLSEHSKEMP